MKRRTLHATIAAVMCSLLGVYPESGIPFEVFEVGPDRSGNNDLFEAHQYPFPDPVSWEEL